ncbi:MAG: co-chaperone GroES [Candidatus Paceibacterota bacterium]
MKKISKKSRKVTSATGRQGGDLKITPLFDRVLIEVSLTDSQMSAGGIIIPETATKEKPEQGKVIAVGEGRVTDNGDIIPPVVKKGDMVIFSKYGPDEIKINDKEYLIVNESQILAILN